MASSTTPATTVLYFGRYLGKPPLDRGSYVDWLRRQQEARRGFNPYSRFAAAVRADLRFGTRGYNLSRVVDSVDARYRPLYRKLAEGWFTFTRDLPGHVMGGANPETAAVDLGNLTVKVNPHVELVGWSQPVVGYLWFDEDPPPSTTREAILRLMQNGMSDISPRSRAAVIDVRRAVMHPASDRVDSRVDRLMASEAAGFVTYWRSAA
jgi:hypothetical protein